eukprot:11196851-Lingulodinium_polyedra.AAC.1
MAGSRSDLTIKSPRVHAIPLSYPATRFWMYRPVVYTGTVAAIVIFVVRSFATDIGAVLFAPSSLPKNP